MYFLNTTRQLVTPATDDTVNALVARLDSELVGTLSSHGVKSIRWLLSLDGQIMQSFSGFEAADDLARAESGAQHRQNSSVINDILGGLLEPQQHTLYRSVMSRQIG